MNVDDPLETMRLLILGDKEPSHYEYMFEGIDKQDYSPQLLHLIDVLKKAKISSKPVDVYMTYLYYYNFDDAYLYVQASIDKIIEHNKQCNPRILPQELFGKRKRRY
jgi:hypothetical protein